MLEELELLPELLLSEEEPLSEELLSLELLSLELLLLEPSSELLSC